MQVRPVVADVADIRQQVALGLPRVLASISFQAFYRSMF
jgi:hypothetical protein